MRRQNLATAKRAGARGRGRRELIAVVGSMCLTQFMISANATMVNVVLPDLKVDMDFTTSGLAWVMNSYLLAISATLLIAGRVADYLGHRAAYVGGCALFCVASVAVGLAPTHVLLVGGRIIQGLAAAAVTASQLALTIDIFRENESRSKALAYANAAGIVGSSLGLVASGVISYWLSWPWVFYANVPMGVAALLLMLSGPRTHRTAPRERGGIGSAILIGFGMAATVLAVTWAAEDGFTARAGATLVGGLALLALFVWIQSIVRNPLLPLELMNQPGLVVSSIVLAICSGLLFGQFFMQAQVLGVVLGYDSWQVGLSFLPINAMIIIFSLGIGRRLAVKWDARLLLPPALLTIAIGVTLYARQDSTSGYASHVLPSLLLLGAGGGIATLTATLSAVSWIPPSLAGVGSGFVRMAQQLGGTLGVTLLASVAAVTGGAVTQAQPLSGYRGAFVAAGVLAVVGAVLALFIPPRRPDAADEPYAVATAALAAGEGPAASDPAHEVATRSGIRLFRRKAEKGTRS